MGREGDRACLEKPKDRPWALVSLEDHQPPVRQTTARILTQEHRCFACRLEAVSLDHRGREGDDEMGLAGPTRTFQPIGRSSGRIERWYLPPEHPIICISFHVQNTGKRAEGGGGTGVIPVAVNSGCPPPKDSYAHLEDRSIEQISPRGQRRIILLQALEKTTGRTKIRDASLNGNPGP